MINIKEKFERPIPVGHQGENCAQKIQFDVTDWVDTYGEGTVALLLKRPGDVIPYPVVMENEDNIYTWIPSETDTRKEGIGEIELQYLVDDVIAKSDVWLVNITKALVSDDAPEPYAQLVIQVAAKAQEAVDAADRAEDAAEIAEKFRGMTVKAETLEAGSEAAVTKTEDETGFELTFGIPAGETGETGPAGPQGETGTRGSQILRVTTALDYYSEPIGDFTPVRRIALATVLSEAQTDEVLVHDVVWRSQVFYNVGAVDSEYVYTGAGVNHEGAQGEVGPAGPAGETGPAGPAGDDYVLTAQDKVDIADIVIQEIGSADTMSF